MTTTLDMTAMRDALAAMNIDPTHLPDSAVTSIYETVTNAAAKAVAALPDPVLGAATATLDAMRDRRSCDATDTEACVAADDAVRAATDELITAMRDAHAALASDPEPTLDHDDRPADDPEVVAAFAQYTDDHALWLATHTPTTADVVARLAETPTKRGSRSTGPTKTSKLFMDRVGYLVGKAKTDKASGVITITQAVRDAAVKAGKITPSMATTSGVWSVTHHGPGYNAARWGDDIGTSNAPRYAVTTSKAGDGFDVRLTPVADR